MSLQGNTAAEGGRSSDQFGAGASFAGAERSYAAGEGGPEAIPQGPSSWAQIGQALKDPKVLQQLGKAIDQAGKGMAAMQSSDQLASQLGIPQLLQRAASGQTSLAPRDPIAQQFSLNPPMAQQILRSLGIG